METLFRKARPIRPEAIARTLSIIDHRWALFTHVAELGSLTHAAAVLDIPQSVLSRHVGALERACGARLFRRTGRGVVLTDVGEQVYPRLKQLLAQADQLSDDIGSPGGQPVGTVRLGMLSSIVPLLAAPLHRAVACRFSRVELHLTEGSSVQLEDWLDQGRLDLSTLLREGAIGVPDERTLQTLSLALIAPAGDPLTRDGRIDFDRLAGLPLVLSGEPHMRARLDSLARERKLKLRIAVKADSISLQREIVAAGGGYAIVAAPTAMPAHFPQSSTAVIVNPELRCRVVLSTTHRHQSRAAAAVSRLIEEVVYDHGSRAILPAVFRDSIKR